MQFARLPNRMPWPREIGTVPAERFRLRRRGLAHCLSRKRTANRDALRRPVMSLHQAGVITALQPVQSEVVLFSVAELLNQRGPTLVARLTFQ